MQRASRRDRALVAVLSLGAIANFAALGVAKSRAYTIPPPTPLPHVFRGCQANFMPDDPGTLAILPHARITTVRYLASEAAIPTDVVVIASRDPNDMHTPERCIIGSGFEIISSDTRQLNVAGPDGGTWALNRLLIRKDKEQELILYGYDGVGTLGGSTVLARMAMKLGAANRKPSYFVRVSSPVVGDVAQTETQLMRFFGDLMRARRSWETPNAPASGVK